VIPENQIQEVITQILRREGADVNDPLDHGGETHFGITIPFAGTYGIPWPPTQQEARDGYRRMLAETHIEDIPDAATLALVADSAVNHGEGRAIKWLQHALSVAEDGVIGPQTIRALPAPFPALTNWDEIYNKVLRQRGMFYAAIIHNDPTQAKFANGWFSRLFEFLT
jgi:lysozyme family protein